MSILKYVDRLKRMDDLIRRKATGTPEQFAEMLHISPSQLYSDLKEMRQMGAPIQYCETRKSYIYERSCKLILDFHTEAQSVKGGQQIFSTFLSAPIIVE